MGGAGQKPVQLLLAAEAITSRWFARVADLVLLCATEDRSGLIGEVFAYGQVAPACEIEAVAENGLVRGVAEVIDGLRLGE